MDAALLPNLVAWAAQVLCIVALAGGLVAVLRLHLPPVRYALWRLLLLICLLLPWLQEARPRSEVAAAAATATLELPELVPQAVSAAPPAPMPFSPTFDPILVVVVLAAGATLRLLWLAAGLRRITRLRRTAAPAPLSADETMWRDAICPRADVRRVDALDGPATFGLWRPVVLLPRLEGHAPDVRRAVLCHELLHARRRDWGWLLLEEIVRAVFWWHPAIWWGIAQVQRAREEVVDREVIRITGARRSYIEALVAFSTDRTPAAAPAFGRPRHLFRRIQLIAQEGVMSRTRLVLSCTGLAVLIASGTWYAASHFPLQAAPAAPQVRDAVRAVAAEGPIPPIRGVVMPRYPAAAAGSGSSGMVLLEVTVDTTGRVRTVDLFGAAVHGLPRDQSLPVDQAYTVYARAARDAVQSWRYEPPPADVRFYVQVTFLPGAAEAQVAHIANRDELPRGDSLMRALEASASADGARPEAAVQAAPVPAPDRAQAPSAADAREELARRLRDAARAVAEQRSPETPDARQQRLADLERGLAGLQEARAEQTGNDGAVRAEIEQLRARVRELQARLAAAEAREAADPQGSAPERGGFRPVQRPDGTPLGGAPGVVEPPPAPKRAPRPTVSVAEVGLQPVRVGGRVQAPKKIKDVKPVYPPIAENARVQGIVILEVLIGVDGRVESAKVLRSIPLLDGAALDAVKQWEFTPTLLDGQPVPLVMSVTVSFTLN